MEMQHYKAWWYVLWTLCAIYLLPTVGKVVVEDYSYKGISIVLPDIPQVEQTEVLDGLQALLNESSKVLHKALSLSISDITVVIPRSWNISGGSFANISIKYVNKQGDFKPDLVVISDETVFGRGRAPVALQDSGCGKEGRKLLLPYNFILYDDPITAKAKRLVREWIKYRYGVFDEKGFKDDTRYPLYRATSGANIYDIEITGCSDKPIQYSFYDSNNDECTLSVNSMTGLPERNESECDISADPFHNGHITSSLLYLDTLPNIEYICGREGHSHNSKAPNKQNAMCNGQSIWDVIAQHDDFRGKSLPTEDVIPSDGINITYVQLMEPRIIVAVDTTGLHDRKVQFVIESAITHFIYSLPKESKFKFLTYEGDDNKAYNVRDTTLEELSDPLQQAMLINRELGPGTATTACLKCITAAAEKILQHEVDGGTGGTVIIISFVEPNSEDLRSRIPEQFKTPNFCLVFMFAKSEAKYREFAKDANCAKFYHIPYELQSPFEILSTTIGYFKTIVLGENIDQHIVIKSGEISKADTVSFWIDGTLQSFIVWLISAVPGTEITRKEVSLKDVNHIDAKGVDSYSITSFARQVNISRASEYLLQIKPDLRLIYEITGVPKVRSNIDVEMWTTIGTIDYDLTYGEQMPIVLCIQVSMHNTPIINAKVSLQIVAPDGSPPTALELYDNGYGDPDVTKNDGIYTRYFTQFTTPGDYHAFIVVDDNDRRARVAKPIDRGSSICCGSEILEMDLKPLDKFRREKKFSFAILNRKPIDDYPPSRVIDLTCRPAYDTNTFILKWTAPGDVMDYGTVQRYDVNLFKTNKDAINFLVENSLPIRIDEKREPKAYGSEQMMTVFVDLPQLGTHYFALRSIGTRGLTSAVSNLAEVFVPEVATTTYKTSNTELEVTSIASLLPYKGSINSTTIGIIVGIIIFLIVIIICIYIAVYVLYIKPKRANRPKADEQNDNQLNNVPQTKEVTSDGSVSANEWQLDRDPISPVNSIPATVLLYHHEQVKEAKRKNRDPPLFKLENINEHTSKNSPQLANGTKLICAELSDNPVMTDINITEENQVTASNVPFGEPQHSKPLRRITNV